MKKLFGILIFALIAITFSSNANAESDDDCYKIWSTSYCPPRDGGIIIEWDKAYFEIDSMVDNQIWGGKDPDYSLAGGLHGTSHSIICTTHMTRMSRLNIEDVRYGTDTQQYDFPKGI